MTDATQQPDPLSRAALAADLRARLDEDGLLVLIYGPSGIGKTVDAAAAAGKGRLISQAGAFLSRLTYLGLPTEPRFQHRIRSLTEVRDLLNGLSEAYAVQREKNPTSFRPRPIVVDDGSLLSEACEADLRKELGGSKNKFAVPTALRAVVQDIRDTIRHMRALVILTCHELVEDDGAVLPKLGSRNSSGSLSPLFDLTLHAKRVNDRPYQHQGAYEVQMELQATSKDRLSVARGLLPMNLRAILATQGVVCPRFPGLEWQDALAAEVQAVAARLAVGPDGLPDWGARADLWEAMLARELSRGRIEPHIAWALRDGLDTHELSVLHRRTWQTALRRDRPKPKSEEV